MKHPNSSHRTFTARENRFDWPLCYKAENFVLRQIEAFCARNSVAAQLAERMRSETGTLLIDWLDHLVLPASAESDLLNAGFISDPLGKVTGRIVSHVVQTFSAGTLSFRVFQYSAVPFGSG